jgi:ribosome-interacting GTPase 1
MNADIFLSCDATEDDLIDVIEANRKYVPCVYVLNKIDQITMEELEVLDKIPHYVPIAGMLGWNFDELLETIWDYQDLVRIYTKPKVPAAHARVKSPTTTHPSSSRKESAPCATSA